MHRQDLDYTRASIPPLIPRESLLGYSISGQQASQSHPSSSSENLTVRLCPREFPEKTIRRTQENQSNNLSSASDLSKRRTHGLSEPQGRPFVRGGRRAGLARGVHWRSRERPRVDRVGPPEKYPRSDQRLRAREPCRAVRSRPRFVPGRSRGVRTADRVSAQRARGREGSGRHGRRLQQETRGETRRRRSRR